MMEKQITVSFKDLSVGYKGRRANKVVACGLNACLRSGELTCMLGPNGVGKSTLLRTLSSFQPPISGAIKVLGRNLSDYGPKDLATVLAVVLTDKCDLQHMTVEEVVSMGRSPYTGFWGKLSVADEEAVKEAISNVGITPLANRHFDMLSDGERQKVMIAKALAQSTPVVFLDEPTAFLDFPSKIEIMRLLHDLSRSLQKTILMSTHDLELALQTADCLWLADGQRLQVGSPEDLSLSGDLEHFFSSKERHIAFDHSTGLFSLYNECTRSVAVRGEGIQYAMLKKALGRNGISVVPEDGGRKQTVVEVFGDKYRILWLDYKPYTVSCIRELLDKLDEVGEADLQVFD